MNHRHEGRKLERNRNQRRALLRGLVESLVLHGKIHTTEARAKELKSRIDRVVNSAREASVAEPSRKVALLRMLRKRLSLRTLEALSEESFLRKFSIRTSGYARVVKLPPRRGDGAKVAIVEFVDKETLK